MEMDSTTGKRDHGGQGGVGKDDLASVSRQLEMGKLSPEEGPMKKIPRLDPSSHGQNAYRRHVLPLMKNRDGKPAAVSNATAVTPPVGRELSQRTNESGSVALASGYASLPASGMPSTTTTHGGMLSVSTDGASLLSPRSGVTTSPALGTSPNNPDAPIDPVLRDMLMDLSIWHCTKKITTIWYTHFHIVRAFAYESKYPEHVVALPFNEEKVRAWHLGLGKLPAFRATDSEKVVGTVTKMVQNYYESIMETKRGDGTERAPWSEVAKAWSRILHYFHDFWHINSDLTQEEAFQAACALGSKLVTAKKHFKDIIIKLENEGRKKYWFERLKGTMAAALREEPRPGGEFAFMGVYFRYRNEEDDMNVIENFLLFNGGNDWEAGMGPDDDGSGQIKLFLRSRAANVVVAFANKQKYKDVFAQLENTWSEAELKLKAEEEAARVEAERVRLAAEDAANKKAERDRQEAEDQGKKQAERDRVAAENLAATQQDERERLAAGDLAAKKDQAPAEEAAQQKVPGDDPANPSKLQANKAPAEDDQKPEAYDGEHGEPQGFDQDETESQSGMVSSVSSEYVDSIDGNGVPMDMDVEGDLFTREERTAKHDMDLKASKVSEVARLDEDGNEIVVELMPSPAKNAEDIIWRSPRFLKLLGKDPWCAFSPPGSKWLENAIQSYVVCMNLVNRVHAKGVVTKAFSETNSSKEGKNEPTRPQYHDLALLLIAMGLHSLEAMGTGLPQVKAGLVKWMPNIFKPLCKQYLAACYEVLTSDKLVRKGELMTQQQADAMRKGLFEVHSESECVWLFLLHRSAMHMESIRRAKKGKLQHYEKFCVVLPARPLFRVMEAVEDMKSRQAANLPMLAPLETHSSLEKKKSGNVAATAVRRSPRRGHQVAGNTEGTKQPTNTVQGMPPPTPTRPRDRVAPPTPTRPRDRVLPRDQQGANDSRTLTTLGEGPPGQGAGSTQGEGTQQPPQTPVQGAPTSELLHTPVPGDDDHSIVELPPTPQGSVMEAEESALEAQRLQEAERDLVEKDKGPSCFTEDQVALLRHCMPEEDFGPLNHALFKSTLAEWGEDTPIGLGSFRTLKPGIWLSDEIINFFIDIARFYNPNLLFFRSFFMTNLLGRDKKPQFNYCRVQGYAARVRAICANKRGLFEQEMICIPIHRRELIHWSLIVVYPLDKIVAYYDSLKWCGKTYVDAVMSYLEMESLAERKQSLDKDWAVTYFSPEPEKLQPDGNDWDCGVYVCGYIETLLLKRGGKLPKTNEECFRSRISLAWNILRYASTPRREWKRVPWLLVAMSADDPEHDGNQEDGIEDPEHNGFQEDPEHDGFQEDAIEDPSNDGGTSSPAANGEELSTTAVPVVDPTIGAAEAAAPSDGTLAAEANSENACSSLLLLAVGDSNDAELLPTCAGDAISTATEGHTN
jgi:Ulp1 protease family, C-terminal catalytic domain